MASLCRVCLVGNVKMHPIESIQKIYESVTNTKLSTVQGPQTVCYLCHSLLHKYGKFTKQARNSENILKDLFNKGIEPNPFCRLCVKHIEATYENIAKTSHIIQINFSTTCVENMDIKDMKNNTHLSHNGNVSRITAKDKDTMDRTRFEAVMIFNEEIDIKEEIDGIYEGIAVEETMDSQLHDSYIEIPPIVGTESINQGVGLGISCDTCGGVFRNKDKILLHIQNCHKPDKNLSEEMTAESFRCTHCNRKFSFKSSLARHMVVHAGEKSKMSLSADRKADFNNEETEELNVLTPKSKHIYLRCYNIFIKWHAEKKFDSFSEKVLMTYFNELAINHKPTTLWNTYSLLKATLSLKHNVHMKHFKELLSFLKTQSNGYKSKKSKVFTAAEIQLFLNEAPDEKYLVMKVVMIMAISGACRVIELINMTVQNLERQGELILVKLRGINRKYNRTFLLKKEYVQIVEKYLRLRPRDMKTDRFFLCYRKGKCVRSVIGKNKMAEMPKLIATYLNLPNPHMYSGRCFRTTSDIL